MTLTFGAPRKGWPTFGSDGHVLDHEPPTDTEFVKALDEDEEARLDG